MENWGSAALWEKRVLVCIHAVRQQLLGSPIQQIRHTQNTYIHYILMWFFWRGVNVFMKTNQIKIFWFLQICICLPWKAVNFEISWCPTKIKTKICNLKIPAFSLLYLRESVDLMQVFSWVENISTRYSTFRPKTEPWEIQLPSYFVKKVEVNFCWKNHAKIYIVQQ